MTCDEFLRLLDADEGWDQGEAAGHAISCPSCGDAVRRMAQAAAGFQAMREDEAPPFLHARVLAHVRDESGKAPWWKALLSPRAAWAGPLIAVAVVAVLGGWGLKQSFWSGRSEAPAAGRALSSEVVQDDKAKAWEERAQAPAPQHSEAGATNQPVPGKGAERRQEVEGGTGVTAPEFSAELPPLAASQIPAEEKRSLEFESSPVEPVTPPFLGAAAEPDGGGVPGGAVAPSAAPAPRGAEGTQGFLKAEAQEEAASRARKDQGQRAPRAFDSLSPEEMVLCTLRGAGGRLYLVQLPASLAPPPGAPLTATVKADGTLEVRDDSGQRQEETALALRSSLDSLELVPGAYTLARRP